MRDLRLGCPARYALALFLIAEISTEDHPRHLKMVRKFLRSELVFCQHGLLSLCFLFCFICSLGAGFFGPVHVGLGFFPALVTRMRRGSLYFWLGSKL